jgi:hypothetical protein
MTVLRFNAAVDRHLERTAARVTAVNWFSRSTHREAVEPTLHHLSPADSGPDDAWAVIWQVSACEAVGFNLTMRWNSTHNPVSPQKLSRIQGDNPV